MTGRAEAWSAPATPGATMASRTAALRPHPRRAPACDRGADPGARSASPTCSWTAARPSTARPEWLVQFAAWAGPTPRVRLGVDEPTVGLLSNGEEPGKGDELRKQTFALLDGEPWFVGNVEGRDLMPGNRDVIVTDGFTGNVALKTVEGALKAAAGLVFTTLGSEPRRSRRAWSSRRCCSKVSPTTSIPTPSAAPRCSASTVCA